MNCANWQEQLVEQAYGELEPRESEVVMKHLASCPACTAFWKELELELGQFKAFAESSELTPSEGMWSSIQSQISEIGTSKSQLSVWQKILDYLTAPALLKQAVFAVLLITASAAITSYYFISHRTGPVEVTTIDFPKIDFRPVPEKQPDPPVPAATPELRARSVKKPNEDEILDLQVRRAAREYENAIRLLDHSIARRKSELDPDAIMQYEASLAMVNESIESSRAALREHPKDPLTARFLLSAYSRKVELMQEIAMR